MKKLLAALMLFAGCAVTNQPCLPTTEFAPVRYGDTKQNVKSIYGLPDSMRRYLIGGLWVEEWVYYFRVHATPAGDLYTCDTDSTTITFRTDKVIKWE